MVAICLAMHISLDDFPVLDLYEHYYSNNSSAVLVSSVETLFYVSSVHSNSDSVVWRA